MEGVLPDSLANIELETTPRRPPFPESKELPNSWDGHAPASSVTR